GHNYKVLAWVHRITAGTRLPLVYVLSLMAVAINLKRQRDKSYQEFICNSPGKEMKSNDIQYGPGHGFSQKISEGESECHVITESIDG
ncbi:MAG: hypothetical protein WCA07_01810, partial [Gloeobacterales cyanobacterium]